MAVNAYAPAYAPNGGIKEEKGKQNLDCTPLFIILVETLAFCAVLDGKQVLGCVDTNTSFCL